MARKATNNPRLIVTIIRELQNASEPAFGWGTSSLARPPFQQPANTDLPESRVEPASRLLPLSLILSVLVSEKVPVSDCAAQPPTATSRR